MKLVAGLEWRVGKGLMSRANCGACLGLPPVHTVGFSLLGGASRAIRIKPVLRVPVLPYS